MTGRDSETIWKSDFESPKNLADKPCAKDVGGKSWILEGVENGQEENPDQILSISKCDFNFSFHLYS